MSTNFYFHSIQINNFRAFQTLKIDKLKRINIFGGFNGIGKTALLETLFFVLDRRNPLALLKPIQFRRYEADSPLDPTQFFHNPANEAAAINFTDQQGTYKISLLHTRPPSDVSLSISSSAPTMGISSSEVSQKGILIETSMAAGEVEERTFILPAPSGAIGNISLTSDKLIPPAQILGMATRGTAQDVASRLSVITRQRRLNELIEHLRLLVPELRNVQNMQDGNVPQIYADVGGDYLPIQYMGDGFQNLFQTLLGIMNAQNGVLLLDEIDAAIHYSKVREIWSIISKMAEAQNCQIFATTHSRECVYSAAEGIRHAGKGSDFQYVRLEKTPTGHFPVTYTIEDIKDAENLNVEIR